MQEFIWGTIAGICLATVAMLTAVIIPALDECEKNLPRTQQCVITAIPKI